MKITKKETVIAKLIIKGLGKMSEIQLRDLIIWLEDKVKEMRDIYGKPLPSKEYDNTYTSRLFK